MKSMVILLTAFLFLLAGCSAEENKEAFKEKEKVKIDNSGEYKTLYSEQKKEVGSNSSFRSITSDEAMDLLVKGDTVIIDVRKQDSYLEAHIPSAQNIPLDGLETRMAEMDKNSTYLIVCKTGKTSETASELLAKNGFENLYNLSGGLDAWKGELVN